FGWDAVGYGSVMLDSLGPFPVRFASLPKRTCKPLAMRSVGKSLGDFTLWVTLQRNLSALAPIATKLMHLAMSCRFVPKPDLCTATKTAFLFDHLVGAREQHGRNGELASIRLWLRVNESTP